MEKPELLWAVANDARCFIELLRVDDVDELREAAAALEPGPRREAHERIAELLEKMATQMDVILDQIDDVRRTQ